MRMLYSQGVALEALGIPAASADGPVDAVAHRVRMADLRRPREPVPGTPSGLWLDHMLSDVFGVRVRLDSTTADETYDQIAECLADDAFRPRALLDRFRIEVVATTDSPLSELGHHQRLVADGLVAA